jgi:hypothetical protein
LPSTCTPHDLRHTLATWLQDAGIPDRVIDEVMDHDKSNRARQLGASRTGMGYRDTTPEMAGRVVAAIETRLTVVLEVAARKCVDCASLSMSWPSRNTMLLAANATGALPCHPPC